ncbi:hypothetical protein L798_05450 [Zootermopsis nevadensis]|uniref:Selenoprotein F/M domain-containing protein n=2 Tax=Zootermopsis nevadensis TaxID=136037 RepID=A0A067R938_ZOONE|nr:hypothetical protein L798_05450 [Zootermopsis nevadensis]
MAPQWLEYVFLIFILMVYETQGDNHERNIFAARVESCSGCRLNRLPEVKKFIFEDVPL